MLKKLLFLTFFLGFITVSGYTQKTTVKGILRDSIAESKVSRAAVTLFNYNDSIMVRFTRSGPAGEFVLNNIPSGKYVLLVTHPMFADYSDIVEVDGSKPKDMGNVNLFSKDYLLKEVTVISSDAIKIKGDTIEYTADSFKVHQDANVEDLLKKLPGIQVNKNGEITAQGKRVEKVLVDGEEFFSDDPTVATQNLKAEAVDKVQVYEKKDEMDGSTDQGTQTINITLKEDAKKGAFGKIKGAAGYDQDQTLFYSNEAMINRFKPKQRASAYLLHSNTGKLNLNWEEIRSYGNGESNFSFDDENGFMYTFSQSTDDEFETWGGGYQGAGIPASISGGATFSNKWGKKDKHSLYVAYQFKQVENEAKTIENSENFLSNTSYFQNDSTIERTNQNRHNVNMKYEFKVDSLSTLKWTFNGSMTDVKKDNFYRNETKNNDQTFANASNRSNLVQSDILNFNTSLNYQKNFKKADRKLNIFTEFTQKSTDGQSDLNSSNYYYGSNDTILYIDTTDQHKEVDKIEQTFQGNITYKEPISKTSVLEFRYIYNMSGQVADRLTYEQTGEGVYTSLIDSLSSKYDFGSQSHRGGMNFNFKKNKVRFKLGADIAKQLYNQVDRLNDTVVKRDFMNVFPNASFVYQFNKMKQFRINYNGYMQQPAIDQIQPLRNNTNPFNITVGNANLNPSFHNDISMQYFDNAVMKGRYFYSWGNLSYVHNDIVTSNSIDSLRRNVTQYVNQSGGLRGSISTNYYQELKKFEMNVNFGLSASYSKNLNFVNDQLNTTVNQSYGGNFDLGKDIGEWFNTSINYSYYQNISGSTIQAGAKINYWTQAIGADMEIVIGKKQRFVFETDASYNLRQKTEQFTQNNNMLLWNASFDAKIFKDKSGTLGIYVNDILNQNLGFQRNASAYAITQTRYNVIKRYFMLSFTWNFNTQKPKGVEDKKE